jgi:hypothetical protein
MCPTSGACIPEELWCDNFEDCPDDEVNCVNKLEPIVQETTNQTITTSKIHFYLLAILNNNDYWFRL